MNTSEKKCEACKTVPHNGHNTDMSCCRHTCQKEQPSIDTVFICQKCRNKKDRWKPGAIVPYCVCEEPTPPQELRQEEWEKEYFDKFCTTRGGGRDGLSDPEPPYDVLYEQDPENLRDFIKSLLKNVEQKAKEEVFKKMEEEFDVFLCCTGRCEHKNKGEEEPGLWLAAKEQIIKRTKEAFNPKSP